MIKFVWMAVVFLCGCQLTHPTETYLGTGPRPGYPCVITKNGMSDCHIDNGIVVSTRVVCDPENPYVTCPLPVTNPVCRDCDCDKPERRDARECRQLREDIESYRRDCVGFLHGVWKDGVCETHSTKRIPKGHTSPIKKNWESWENVECVSIHDGTEKP